MLVSFSLNHRPRPLYCIAYTGLPSGIQVFRRSDESCSSDLLATQVKLCTRRSLVTFDDWPSDYLKEFLSDVVFKAFQSYIC